jgi:polyphosphate kinase 2 (PPK2 family)
MRVHSITPPRTYETQYPWLHRFWLKTPSYGQIAIFDRSWYREVLEARARRQLDGAAWQERCDDIVAFERQLATDGTIIAKFWLHITKNEQERRFQKLAADPLTAWQVTDEDRWQQRHYQQVRAAVEDLLARTDVPSAPWIVLPATDRRYAQLMMVETVVNALGHRLGLDPEAPPQIADDVADEGGTALRHRLDQMRGGTPHGAVHAAPQPLSVLATTMDAALLPPPAATTAVQTTSQPLPASAIAIHAAPLPPPTPAATVMPYTSPGILARVDLSQRIDPAETDGQLARLQAKLHLLGFQLYQRKRPAVVLFEGWDAAGKGGAIHRITAEIDPRSYIVHPIAAPAGEDKLHHYLYRFWRRLPPRGQIAIFDRSWYGRVLVERVEGFARPDEWQRAYAELNEFERQLVAFGTIIVKFWLHISPEEQLRRFEERQRTAVTSWKLTDEDWRNREKWALYEQAADEMLLRTSTPAAPWTIVEAEDKRFGRIKVLRTVVRRLEDELGKVKLR